MTFRVRRATCDVREDPLSTSLGRNKIKTGYRGNLATFLAPHVARRTNHGFTLMELVVVIAILALSAAIVIPLLPATDSANLKNSARGLSTVIRYLGERSVTTKSGYRLVMDLNQSRITVRKMVNGEETVPEDPFLSRNVLSEGVNIEDVELQRLGKVNEGEVKVGFGVAGLGEFLVVHLKGRGDERFTVTALPGGGRVEALEGYREMAR